MTCTRSTEKLLKIVNVKNVNNAGLERLDSVMFRGLLWQFSARQTTYIFFSYLVCEAIGTAATPGLLCQPRVIVKMIVETLMECRLVGETEVLGENLP
jgi:hypothetical protein